jgi:hypothetical protein
MKNTIRRTALYTALIAAAFSSAVATGAAVSTIAMGATISMPAAAHSACAVSPRMTALIEMYKAVSANIDSLDPLGDQAAWTAAEQAWGRGETHHQDQPPPPLLDYAAKLDALIELDSSEGEYATIKRLSEDAHALAGVK